jgi:hypothetical protein
MMVKGFLEVLEYLCSNIYIYMYKLIKVNFHMYKYTSIYINRNIYTILMMVRGFLEKLLIAVIRSYQRSGKKSNTSDTLINTDIDVY